MSAPEPWICVTCGVQYNTSEQPPTQCPTCEDPRQYLRHGGQEWTTRTALEVVHRNAIEEEEPGLWSIHTQPVFAIGQRAFFVKTAEGNLLWDSVSLVDDATVARVRELGGVRAIAISHPHYYSSVVDWSDAFGGAEIWIHEADRQWVQRNSLALRFWSGEQHPLFGGLSLIHSGGHFDGYQVALWPAGAQGKGVLLAGDQPQVCLDRKWVTFMYSYPNWIPLGPGAVRRIAAGLAQLEFDRMYGAFGRHLMSGARQTIARSAERYLRAIAE
ncbi:MAG: MBL fold metallo-hydrolase [Bryobacteraceae bacterium]